MTRLRADNLSWSQGGRQILDQVSLSFAGLGPIFIIGPNGAGKSVLLRMLHGLLQPDSGAVLVDDRPLNMAARRAQAMVFQKPVMLRRSVQANLDFALNVAGRPASEAATWLEAAGLQDKVHQPAKSLSGGEAQRLAVARALAIGPKTLFLDEPTSALDPAATAHIEGLITRAVQDGVQVIMISHDIGQVRRLAQEVVMLHQGRVLETGPADVLMGAAERGETRAFVNGDLLV